jgi:hypothetical protein
MRPFFALMRAHAITNSGRFLDGTLVDFMPCKYIWGTCMASIERRNVILEKIVDRGIALDGENGSIVAWVYLRRHGVAPETILRVLAAPGRRRGAAKSGTTAQLARVAVEEPATPFPSAEGPSGPAMPGQPPGA